MTFQWEKDDPTAKFPKKWSLKWLNPQKNGGVKTCFLGYSGLQNSTNMFHHLANQIWNTWRWFLWDPCQERDRQVRYRGETVVSGTAFRLVGWFQLWFAKVPSLKHLRQLLNNGFFPKRKLVFLPSREWSHIPPWEKENHLQKCRLGWDMLVPGRVTPFKGGGGSFEPEIRGETIILNWTGYNREI